MARLRPLDLGDRCEEVGILAQYLEEESGDADGAVSAGELKVAVDVGTGFA